MAQLENRGKKKKVFLGSVERIRKKKHLINKQTNVIIIYIYFLKFANFDFVLCWRKKEEEKKKILRPSRFFFK